MDDEKKAKKMNKELANELKLRLGDEKYSVLKSQARALRCGEISSKTFLRAMRLELELPRILILKICMTIPERSLKTELLSNVQYSSTLIIIYFHHLLSEYKREMILEKAKTMKVDLCISCYGTPGILVLEGETQTIKLFLTILRDQRWQTMDIRACRSVVCISKHRRYHVFDDRIIEVGSGLRNFWLELERLEKSSRENRSSEVHGSDFDGFEYVRQAIICNHKVPKKLFRNPFLPPGGTQT